MQISIFNRWQSDIDSFSINDLIINYTGEYTDTIITDTNSISYRLLTFTSSGELVLSHNVIGELWYCNGGNRGQSTTGRGGSGGSFCPATTISLDTNPIQISIGLSDQATQFGNFIPNELIQGSGGGGSGTSSSTGASGGNVSTVPYLDELNFQPHCAGGGGGGYIRYTSSRYRTYIGGTGGSNGSNGGNSTTGSLSSNGISADGGSGGNYGGGEGGMGLGHSTAGEGYPGTKGSFYGAGGGGGGIGNIAGTTKYSSPGLGYQGVVYLRFPL